MDRTDLANQVVALVNQQRAENGLSALSVNSQLQQAAQERAQEQVELYSHTRPDGTRCFTILEEYGIDYSGAGENIAYGQRSPEAVMDAWMNSQGHRANILNTSFDTIGVGCVEYNGTLYWVQMFIKQSG